MGIEWDPALALGHEEIDGQHREIFRRYAALVKAMDGRTDGDLTGLFDFLGEYAAQHFAAEERVMAETAYPGARLHAASHARFVREYRELRELWRANGATRGIAVKARIWIGDWLRAHISKVDLALARHLRARAARGSCAGPGGSGGGGGAGAPGKEKKDDARVDPGAVRRHRAHRRAAP